MKTPLSTEVDLGPGHIVTQLPCERAQSVDDRLRELVNRVRIDLVLAADSELPQSLVCGAAPAPLGQHQIVGDSICLVSAEDLRSRVP